LGDPAVLLTCNKLVKKTLKWQPSFTLKDMITSDIKFRQKHKLDF
jgi:UDP-glucose 4-epimerase